ncbi:MAG: hypothetical protein AAFV62_02430 [Pseudomonadota bacterium]
MTQPHTDHRPSRRTIAQGLAIAGVTALLASGYAAAQDQTFDGSSRIGQEGYDLSLGATGFDRTIEADREREQRREELRPFGDSLSENGGFNDGTSDYRPLNEFAGQQRPYDRGVVGDALGAAKRSILGPLFEPKTE